MTSSSNTVLIIDDDDSLAQLLSLTLQLEGFQVLRGCDGVEAKRLLSEHAVNLIVLDLMMPTLDGLGFLHWLRQEQKHDTLVLVQTAMTRDDTRDKVLAAGADALIFKPYGVNEFLAQVKRLLNRPDS